MKDDREELKEYAEGLQGSLNEAIALRDLIASRDLLVADNAALIGDLGDLQGLLAGLLEESTVLVTKGGVATYKTVLTVGQYVDLCRAAGVAV